MTFRTKVLLVAFAILAAGATFLLVRRASSVPSKPQLPITAAPVVTAPAQPAPVASLDAIASKSEQATVSSAPATPPAQAGDVTAQPPMTASAAQASASAPLATTPTATVSTSAPSPTTGPLPKDLLKYSVTTNLPPRIDEVTATERMVDAHATLRKPEVASPDSAGNRRILQTMLNKALVRANVPDAELKK